MKKKIILVGTLSLTMLLAVGAAAVVFSTKGSVENNAIEADTSYTHVIDYPLYESEEPCDVTTVGYSTALGNPVNFTFYKLYDHPGDGTVHDDHPTAVNGIANGGYIAVTGNSKGYGFAGIKSVVVSANCKDYYNYTMTAQYGWESGEYIEATQVVSGNVQYDRTVNFNYDQPSFFKITFNKTEGADIMIDKITITYTCVETENPYVSSGDWTAKYVSSRGGYLITKYSGTSTSLSFPSKIDGHDIIGINNYLQYESITSAGITAVSIPEGYTYIGHEAFATQYAQYYYHEADNLTSVTLPSTLVGIGDSAFYGAGLTSIYIPKSVTSIGQYAFRNATACTSLQFELGGSDALSIGGSAFGSNRHTGDLTLPKRVAGSAYSIGDYAFDSMPNVTAFKMEDNYDEGGIRCVGGVLFEGTTLYNYPIASTETEYTIPTWCTGIRDHEGFNSVKNLEVVNFTNTSSSQFNATSYCFSGCSNLREVNFSTGNTYIYWYTFRGCSKLSGMVIPENVRVGNSGLGDMGGTTADPVIIYSEAGSKPANWDNNWDGGDVASGKLVIYYYSESEAAGYWHYVAGVPTLW